MSSLGTLVFVLIHISKCTLSKLKLKWTDIFAQIKLREVQANILEMCILRKWSKHSFTKRDSTFLLSLQNGLEREDFSSKQNATFSFQFPRSFPQFLSLELFLYGKMWHFLSNLSWSILANWKKFTLEMEILLKLRCFYFIIVYYTVLCSVYKNNKLTETIFAKIRAIDKLESLNKMKTLNQQNKQNRNVLILWNKKNILFFLNLSI